MAQRGSLKLSIQRMVAMWDAGHQGLLSVVLNPHGKYYTIMTDDDLKNKYNDQGEASQRLVLRVTKKELWSIMQTDQLTLFKEEPNGDSQTPVQTGQLDGDNATD